MYSERVVKAFEFAHELHASQRRKGSDVPYLTHVLAVAALVGEHRGDEDQFIAALLHDAAEDCGGQETLSRIRDAFGDTVAGYVKACSDSLTTPKPPWRERKEKHLAALREAPLEVRLLIAADKLHNARSIARDLGEVGESLWTRFKGGRAGTLWYYGAMLDFLREGWNHPILDELAESVGRMNALTEADEPAG
jgi:(p)ppGpp synthase/HD superfamily hydrolase